MQCKRLLGVGAGERSARDMYGSTPKRVLMHTDVPDRLCLVGAIHLLARFTVEQCNMRADTNSHT